MTRSSLAPILVVALVVGIPRPASVWAQGAANFGGRWTLNRGLSQFPREIGFNAGFLSPGVGNRAFTPPRESQEDAARIQQLTADVRNPSAHLTIFETPSTVIVTDDNGKMRTFHLNGRQEQIQLDSVPVDVIATREAGRLIVVYKVESGRELRYTYSRVGSPAQLVVDVQFVERGGGDQVKRVYEPASATDTLAPVTPAPSAATATPSSGVPAQTFNQQPGAEFKGLTTLGLVLEDLSPQAAACGLSQGTIETAVSKRLTDAGFRVIRNSDEDTYVYVNIITTTPSAGLCVSRYDVFVYTHTTARLSYQPTPVLVQVSLLHRGGLTGGAPAAHADGVLRGVQEYVDQFATRIRDANK